AANLAVGDYEMPLLSGEETWNRCGITLGRIDLPEPSGTPATSLAPVGSRRACIRRGRRRRESLRVWTDREHRGPQWRHYPDEIRRNLVHLSIVGGLRNRLRRQ